MDIAASYSNHDHTIDNNNIPEEAKMVVRQLRRAGFIAYLVGGSVRDLCLGRQPKDFDIATSAQPEQIKPLFRNSLIIGRRFRLVHVRFKKMILEVATFRAGDTSSDDLIIHDNTWGNPQEDALRRDFTINGLFYDIDEQTIIDFVGGFEDLKKGILRTIGEPALRFRQDPVRMLRLIKFKARYPEMQISSDCMQALMQSRHEIIKSSAARLLEEVLRMLESGYSARFFQMMSEYGLLEPLMPYLQGNISTHEKGCFLHYIEACDRLNQDRPVPLHRDVLLASLVYGLIEQHLAKSPNHPIRSHELLGLAHDQIDLMVGALRQLPKRMRACVGQIIALQARLCPIEGKSHIRKKSRLAAHPDFIGAMQLLQVRCSVQPHLLPFLELWQNISVHSHCEEAICQEYEGVQSNTQNLPSGRSNRGKSKNRPARRAREKEAASEDESEAGMKKEPRMSQLLPPPTRLIAQSQQHEY